VDIYLGLGSNVGERERALRTALHLLEGQGVAAQRVSSLYLTEPVGGPPQDWFLNMVVAASYDRSPEELLAACLLVERALGRERRVRNGPRTMDIDVLLFGSEQRNQDGLTIPHPRLHERRFVLEPLAEIAPDLLHPVLQMTVGELLEKLEE
jgi:2-amino-4-hydroxy-6-hydroxymethyldihydropteridine diphosphokinase